MSLGPDNVCELLMPESVVQDPQDSIHVLCHLRIFSVLLGSPEVGFPLCIRFFSLRVQPNHIFPFGLFQWSLVGGGDEAPYGQIASCSLSCGVMFQQLQFLLDFSRDFLSMQTLSG